jgi:hypothetical protein
VVQLDITHKLAISVVLMDLATLLHWEQLAAQVTTVTRHLARIVVLTVTIALMERPALVVHQ